MSEDGDLLVAAAQLALLGLTASLVSALAERARRADAELQRIRPLQDVLAPRKPPSLPLLELASRYIPAQSGVSGDFYQVAEARNGAVVLVIGDVVGKGLAAARRSTFVRAMVTACAPYLDDPAAILRTVNTELVHQHGASAQFITMLCVVVKPDMTLTWASAGHPPPVSLTDGEPLGHLPTGHPLGIAPEIADLEIGHAALPAGGILLYTDGLTDARPPGRTLPAVRREPHRALPPGARRRRAGGGGRAPRPRRPRVLGRLAPRRPVRRRGPAALPGAVVRERSRRASSPGSGRRAAGSGSRRSGRRGGPSGSGGHGRRALSA